MEPIIATSANYWISPRAISITLNALGDPNRIQASVAAGAAILVYIRGVKPAGTTPDDESTDYSKNGDGLEYDVAHNYRRWTLNTDYTFFNSSTPKYVYVAVPRVATEDNTTALVVFPSKKIDIYGYVVEEQAKRNSRGYLVDEDGNPVDDESQAAKELVQGEQIGTDDYFYIWLQGIISDTDGTTPRQWTQDIEWGYLDSDESISSLETSWYRWDPISQTVTFLKEIIMDVGSKFQNLEADLANIFNLNVKGLLTAIAAKINDIRSENYEAGLTDGAGFRLTADNGEGSSLLEVDFLNVRKKATFMELEVRKETYVGGNQTYSPAGSVIWRVEYMDEHDERLGYTTMKVPFLLKRFAFLGGMFRRAFNYAARKWVFKGIEPDEWRNVHHFRCYLLADDGTTATRNWWRVGDQVKCITFNKATSENKRNNGNWNTTDRTVPSGQEQTGPDPTGISNTYFWRLVERVGSAMLDDGYVYDYIDLPCEDWYGYSAEYKGTIRDGGSDRPSAGDTIVCVGNRYDELRMNLVQINTYGEDNYPPSIVGYRGVYKFELTKSNKVFQISPEEVMFRARRFVLLNDDDEGFPTALERGEWDPGKRYRYGDRVSWNGSIWRCIVVDDDIWENMYSTRYNKGTERWELPDGSTQPAGPLTDVEQGEGRYEYIAYDYHVPILDGDDARDGDEVYHGYDHFYGTGKVAGQTVYKIKAYTYLEPSDLYPSIWLCEVSKGTEITESIVRYAASYDGMNHPDDESEVWKSTIQATGVKAGMYLWTRRTTYYRDQSNPDREPTVEYSVSRWGIDGDGIASINSLYTCTDVEIDDMAAYEQTHTVSWYDTFAAAVYVTHKSIGELQGWYIWEKTVIRYDNYYTEANAVKNPDGTYQPGKAPGDPMTTPDLVSYRVTRIGQDGQIGMEEYYCLRESDNFDEAFPISTGLSYPDPCDIGIHWMNQADPAEQDYRLESSGNWMTKICTKDSYTNVIWKRPTGACPIWSPTMPVYDPEKPTFKYLWNFEQRVDGMGTEYATRPVCIGNHARGIKGVIELYACSASNSPKNNDILIPDDLYQVNGYGTLPPATADFSNLKVWSDEKYDRAPTEKLPYQWNWTRTLYSAADESGKTYEDHYHVSSVKGTRGEDGAGVERIYCRTKTATAPTGHNGTTGTALDNNPASSTYGKRIAIKGKTTINGVEYNTCQTVDDFVPDKVTTGNTDDPEYLWTDNPVGIDQEHPYEWVCERTSKSYAGSGGFAGGHTWTDFGSPAPWSKWGYNGQDGDGTEYVFMRTKNDVAPTFAVNDGGSASDYKSMEWRPYINNKGTGSGQADAQFNQCTDDPMGTNRDWPYEWVAKRNMGAAATSGTNQGRREWKSYYECMDGHAMVRWSTYITLRLDIDNELDMVPTTDKLLIEKDSTKETVVRLYDGAKEVTLGEVSVSGGPATSGSGKIADYSQTASGNARKLSWKFLQGKTMAETYEITISYTYNNTPYSATFTIVASKGIQAYQLKPSQSSIKFKRNKDNELISDDNTLSLRVIDLAGASTSDFDVTSKNLTDHGLTIRYSVTSMPTSKADGTAWPISGSSANKLAVSSEVQNVYVAMFNTGGALLDRETVPVVADGENGSSPYFSDIDNEMLSVACTYDGKTAAAFDKTVNVRMWHGSKEQKLTKLTTTSVSNVTITPTKLSTTGGTVRVQISKGTAIAATSEITITIACDGSGDQTLHLYLNGVRPGKEGDAAVIYDLIPSASHAKRDKDGNVSPSSLTCDVQRTEGTSVSRATSDHGTLRYRKNRDITSSSDGTALTINSGSVSLANTDTYVVFAFFVGTTMVDKERVPVVYDGDDGDDAVVYTIECADTIKPGDTSLSVSIKKAVGSDIQTKPLQMAGNDWSVVLSGTMDGGGSVTVNMRAGTVTLDGTITAASVLTLTLKIGDVTVATKTIRAVADGATGKTGHVGRWYYYAGEWDANTTYKMEETIAPFVKYGSNFYMLDNHGGNATSIKTMPPDYSGSGNPWSPMTAVFKYMITEATFSDYAHLAAFVFNGDWMISCNGTINGVAQESSSWQNPEQYTIGGVTAAAYTWFDPAHPNEHYNGSHNVNGKTWDGPNFIPNFAIDGLSGKTYQNAAYVKGQIMATGGEIAGNMNITSRLTVGTYGAGNKSIILKPDDVNGAGISAYNGTTRVFRLGFNGNGHGYLSLESSYMQKDFISLIDDKGNTISISTSPDESTGRTRVTLNRIVNGSNKQIEIGISKDGVAILKSNCWPKSSSSYAPSDLDSGSVYVDYQGFLKVKS